MCKHDNMMTNCWGPFSIRHHEPWPVWYWLMILYCLSPSLTFLSSLPSKKRVNALNKFQELSVQIKIWLIKVIWHWLMFNLCPSCLSGLYRSRSDKQADAEPWWVSWPVSLFSSQWQLRVWVRRGGPPEARPIRPDDAEPSVVGSAAGLRPSDPPTGIHITATCNR